MDFNRHNCFVRNLRLYIRHVGRMTRTGAVGRPCKVDNARISASALAELLQAAAVDCPSELPSPPPPPPRARCIDDARISAPALTELLQAAAVDFPPELLAVHHEILVSGGNLHSPVHPSVSLLKSTPPSLHVYWAQHAGHFPLLPTPPQSTCLQCAHNHSSPPPLLQSTCLLILEGGGPELSDLAAALLL